MQNDKKDYCGQQRSNTSDTKSTYQYGYCIKYKLIHGQLFQGVLISNRIEGTIIWYSSAERYGIIRQAFSSKTISVDQSQIHFDSLNDVGPLCIGQKVSFVVNNGSAEDLYLL